MVSCEPINEQAGEETVAPTELARLGDIFVPDTDNCLVISSQVYYDDAPWISSSLKASANKYIHASFTSKEAKAIGAKSLRAQLFSGDEIMCPEAHSLRKLLGTDGIEDLLSDLLAFSDYIGGIGLHIVYDSRTFNSESLMHPGLREAQGPSLVAYIEGPVLRSEQIEEYLGKPVMLAPLSDERTANHEQRIYPKCGKRLGTCFAVTDCLQILTGREFFLFDPCGNFVLRSDADEAVRNPEPVVARREAPEPKTLTEAAVPTFAKHDTVQVREITELAPEQVVQPTNSARGQKCTITRPSSSSAGSSGKGQDIYYRFPDQFAGFVQIPFRVQESLMTQGAVQGVFIRMPLRRQKSALSEYIPTIEDIKSGLREYKNLLRCSLNMGTTLSTGSVSHFDDAASAVVIDFEVSYWLTRVLRCTLQFCHRCG